ncbi:MAG: YlxR family protein [Polyangiaceae bacterium]|nr:YlxR family protein [Polyangiaceae bacterium]
MTPRQAPVRAADDPSDGSVRTCVGCGRRDAAPALLSLWMSAGVVVCGLSRGRATGRGAHVHPRPRCLEDAARRGLARSMRREVRVRPEELRRRALEAARTCAADALARAAGGGALEKSGSGLHVVASDAGPPSPEVARAIGAGRAVCLGTREELGSLLGVDAADWVVVTSGAQATRLCRAAAVTTALAGSEVT